MDLCNFTCTICNKNYSLVKKRVIDNKRRNRKNLYCSLDCQRQSQRNKSTLITTNCGNCNKQIMVKCREAKKSKSGKSFCSRSCSGTYNNTHKTTGNRRSKLEVWLEEQLTKDYPDLKALYNNKEIINSELDIYFPDLKLAVELNGIFHYEPIYGQDKLEKIINNDNRKFQACLEKDIELLIIDVSSLKYFKLENVKKYYDIITNILARRVGLEPT